MDRNRNPLYFKITLTGKLPNLNEYSLISLNSFFTSFVLESLKLSTDKYFDEITNKLDATEYCYIIIENYNISFMIFYANKIYVNISITNSDLSKTEEFVSIYENMKVFMQEDVCIQKDNTEIVIYNTRYP